MASHDIYIGLAWSRLGLANASPEQPRSVPGAYPEHPRRTVCSVCTTKNSCSGSQTAVIGGSSEQQAGLRPGPGSAPDRAPPRTGLNSGSIEARFEPDFTGTSGVRPVSAREMSPRRVEALKAERISSDDVLKAFTLWGFSDSVHISRALQGRAPGVPVKCPLALLGPRLEPGKLVQIIMSRIMFYYVPIMFIMSGIMSGNFAPNLNQTGWFK